MRGIKVTKQHHDWDCGVASISMLLGVPYGDVAKVVRDSEVYSDPRLKSRGIILRQLEYLLSKFGFTTKRIYRKRGYLDGATGILGMNGGNCDPSGHWVVIKDGQILDPSDETVTSVEDYIKEEKCRPATLVVLA